MNMLISTITDDYVDGWVSGLLDELKVENCVAIFYDNEIVRRSRVGKEYATYKFLFPECVYATYEILQERELPPIDNEILKQMEPFESEWFWMAERNGNSFQRRWREYCNHIRVWNYILDFYHIDVFLSGNEPHEIFDYIIYALCKIKGIHFVSAFTVSQPLGYTYLAKDVYTQLPELTACIQELGEMNTENSNGITLNEEFNELYNSLYEKRDLTPWYMKIWEKDYGLTITRSCLRFLQIIKNRVRHILIEILYLFLFDIRMYARTEDAACTSDVFQEYETLFRFYQKHTTPVDYTSKYIYVALHMQPEATSSPFGGRYVDQLLMIQMLSFFLPEGYWLYVKEHPSQRANERINLKFRTLSFYQELLKISRVRLVSCEEDTYKLIKESCGVASLTGTVGMEAMAYNKLFFMFGFGLMEYAPNTVVIRNLEDCRLAMNKMTSWHQEPEEMSRKMKIYFKALEKFLIKGSPYLNEGLIQVVPEGYWDESKQNLITAFRKKMVECMGECILR